MGVSACDESTDFRQIQFNVEEGFSTIVAGKEFVLLVSSTGKVF